MIKIEATQEEWNVLMALLDSAVRQRGLAGAGSAVGWAMKIEQAIKDAQPKAENVYDLPNRS